MEERWKGRVALVTGASAGIGACLTKDLVKRGMKVVACARNVAKLEAMREELSQGQGHERSLTVVTCDVSKEDDVMAMFDVIRKDPNLGRLDVCVNNAGFAKRASILSGNTEDWRSMYETNVLGLMMCSREAVKLMREKNVDDGQIVLVNSMIGVKTPKRTPVHGYMITKHAVSVIKDALRNELRELKSHIRVSCLQPQDVADNILHILDTPPHVEVTDIWMPPTEQDDL